MLDEKEVKDVFLGEGYNGQETKSFDEAHWQEVYQAYQNKRIIKGEVSAIETVELKQGDKNQQNELCMIVYFGDTIKGIIPAVESGIMDKTGKNPETGAIRLKASMSNLMGRSVVFKVKIIDRQNSIVLLSRKDALEHMKGITWKKIKVDDTVNAIVRRVNPYIAVLNIGGIEAMLPAKEMSHGWVWDARELLKVDDNIQVKITELDKDNNKLTVSLKAILSDKWPQAIMKYAKGGEYLGKVSGIKEYGVFINLESSVDALIRLPKSEKTLAKMRTGMKVSIRISDIDNKQRRIQGTLVKILE